MAKYLQPEDIILTDVGPCLHEEGVTYRVWAHGHKSVVAHIERKDGSKLILPLEPAKESGFFFGIDPQGRGGDLYKYALDNGTPIPDFVSHFQPQGVHGPSMVVDAGAFEWKTKDWQRPAWKGQVVYECHLGTFTADGTYLSAIERLDHLAELGITALEIMPVADFPGERNWGYDGVMLFAPSRAYGTPDDFRALIDACHARGLAVILDVVFNHLGPDGNFCHQYSERYFHHEKSSAWGQNFNLDGPDSRPVRAMLCQNIRYWLQEFRMDGFRMDATHAVHDPSPSHLLADVAKIVHEHGAFIVAEDERNAREVLETTANAGWNFDAAWADDYHHVLRISQTKENQSFYERYEGSPEEIVKTLLQGWLFCGDPHPLFPEGRGTPCQDFAPERFVYFISNHDQVGNRLEGERLHDSISPAAYRALSLFLCLSPYTPMLFMGQEWAATSPFLYFTKLPKFLGDQVTAGRQREALASNFAKDKTDLLKMANPQDRETFLRSKLKWSERYQEKHRRVLDLYRASLKLRRELFVEGNPPRDAWKVEALGDTVAVAYQLGLRRITLYLHLKTRADFPMPEGKILLRSNAPEFTSDGEEGQIEAVVIEG